MKKLSKILIPMLVLATLLISACAGAAPSTSGSDKVSASPVEFTGVIEAINGNQWTVNGQVITVDPSVLRDGPFIVGNTIKVQAEVQQDGSIVVTRVEAPTAADNSNDVNSNDANGNDVNSNDDNSNGDNSNDGSLTIDDSGSEAFGTVDSVSADAVVIGGQTFTITNSAEFKDQIQAGDFVKVHFALNADGTMSILEIESWDSALVGNDNSSDSNTNDDNGNDSNSNDDNGNDDNSNDDNGNDDNSNDDNGNDDSKNDNGGGGDDGGGNDNGGNSNGG